MDVDNFVTTVILIDVCENVCQPLGYMVGVTYVIINYRVSHLIRRFFSHSEVYLQITLLRNTGKF